MEIKSIMDLYNLLHSEDLEPNEYFYLLLFINEGEYRTTRFNIHQVRRSLYRKGWLDKEYSITAKAKTSILFKGEIKLNPNSDEYLTNVIAYRDLFPKMILPNGKPARSSVIELKRRFDWFNVEYKYGWDVILKATENYIKHYEQNNYNFMQTSGYFIKKEDKGKITSSALSEWCEQVLNPNESSETKSYEIDI